MKQHITIATLLACIVLLCYSVVHSQSYIPAVPAAPPITGFGVPVQVGVARQAGINTAVTTTTLFTVGAATTQYKIDATVYCTQAVATATATLTIGYTDTSGTAQTITPAAAACTTLGASSFTQITSTIVAQNATNITYAVAIANGPKYDVRVQVYQLSSN